MCFLEQKGEKHVYIFFSQDAHLARSCGARETEGEMVHVNKGNPLRVAWFIPMDGNTLQMIQYLVPFQHIIDSNELSLTSDL